jgi:hypothetical protein
MSKVTELASAQLSAVDAITIELLEADETPAVVIISWPLQPTVVHPHRFPSAADSAVRIFVAAVVQLASIRRERKP